MAASPGAFRRFIGVRKLVGVIAQIRVELPFARQVDASGRRRGQPFGRATGDPRSNQARQGIDGNGKGAHQWLSCWHWGVAGNLPAFDLTWVGEFTVSTTGKCRLQLLQGRASRP
jgi:hypothetical protein